MPKASMSIVSSGNNRIFATNGYWSISIFYDKVKRDFDFTIGVMAGETTIGVLQYVPFYRFDPEEIEKDIVRSCGQDTYKAWKKQVMSDIDSLHQLVHEVSQLIDRPISSITCCNRSELLCKKVGLEVIERYVFLVPLQ